MKNAVSIVLSALLLMPLMSCENSYSVFSTKYRVNFRCDPNVPPFNSAVSMGTFVSVRCPGTELVVTDSDGKVSKWQLSEMELRNSAFGLGGIIIGTPSLDNVNGDVYAYDLACPSCDDASARLKFDGTGVAVCPDCKTRYNLNNNGFVISSETDASHPLYRYPVSRTLESIIVAN